MLGREARGLPASIPASLLQGEGGPTGAVLETPGGVLHWKPTATEPGIYAGIWLVLDDGSQQLEEMVSIAVSSTCLYSEFVRGCDACVRMAVPLENPIRTGIRPGGAHGGAVILRLQQGDHRTQLRPLDRADRADPLGSAYTGSGSPRVNS